MDPLYGQAVMMGEKYGLGKDGLRIFSEDYRSYFSARTVRGYGPRTVRACRRRAGTAGRVGRWREDMGERIWARGR